MAAQIPQQILNREVEHIRHRHCALKMKRAEDRARRNLAHLRAALEEIAGASGEARILWIANKALDMADRMKGKTHAVRCAASR